MKFLVGKWKNSWSVFYLILLTNTLVLLLLTYGKYQDLKQDKYAELGALTKLLSHSMHSKLVENELLLDLLGKQLLEDNRYQDRDKTQALLKGMLESNRSLGGFGLVNPQGDFIAVSDNIDPSQLNNLLEQEITRDSFKQALNRDQLVLGRTYNFKAGSQWALPLRKALRNASGKVVAVMTTGLRVDNNSLFDDSDFKQSRRAMLINAHNYFHIYFSGLNADQYRSVYSRPLTPQSIASISSSLQKDYGVTLQQAQQFNPNVPLFMERHSDFFKGTIIESAIYEPVYGVWTVISEPVSVFYNRLWDTFSQYLLIFVLSNFMIYGLVRTFSRYEASTRKKLLFQANHDPLTGLYNRNYLNHKFQNHDELKQRIKVLFVDLDNFKNINDTFGHAVGDKLLIQVANRLRRFVSEQEQVVRFGGDEFVVLLFDGQNEQQIAASIIQTLSETYLIEGMRFNIGASVGIAYAVPHQYSLETALSHADIAMYQAKKRKNSIEIFSDELQNQLTRKTALEHHLRSAVRNREIYLTYQPQLTPQQELYGVEALVRWNNPKLGQVSPIEFISVAEEIGIMPQLGRFIAQTALVEIGELQQRLNSHFKLSINVSVAQFMEAGLCEELTQSILDSQLQSKQITIEVTESLFIESLDRILPILKRFKAQHISLSLDDFGTGFSSLSLLRKLPINELKIDKMFVDDIQEGGDDGGLIENIIDIAQKMGIHTVAEGVEHAYQAKALETYGCDLYQGYLFAKPLTKAELEQFILDKQANSNA
ncbi:EAL domain-containing protein [Thiomicrorhabdus sp. zzn3]|uniref:bifunctional diguanylate cyclase/phosphodiesterase n=1 Tax=Thiomicrorhabdus sp. zzn3 TaxID=3039775 RepID=UPI0024371DDE|nr:EAL domain-containing protein [Thiomicrorhabdus sp. zzn3]MDG6777200.1 EAL domain-containing protein [Thiomicrorhabdus sp. zzn3]